MWFNAPLSQPLEQLRATVKNKLIDLVERWPDSAPTPFKEGAFPDWEESGHLRDGHHWFVGRLVHLRSMPRRTLKERRLRQSGLACRVPAETRIGEVADQLAINPRTIRYYEAVGLVPEPSRTQFGYRDYGEVDLRRIPFIKTAQRLDLSIDEIPEILAFTDRSQMPCGHVREVVRRKTQELDDRIAEMIQLRDELTEIESSVPVTIGPGDTALCPLIEHRG